MLQQDGSFAKVADVLGLGARRARRLALRQLRNDAVTGEVIYSTGDANGITDGTLQRRHHRQHLRRARRRLHHSGAYLLMPHANVVNRYYSAVPDLSNQGYGLIAGTRQRQLRSLSQHR